MSGITPGPDVGTQYELDENHRSLLRSLSKLNRDAAEGFEQAADHIPEPLLKAWARDTSQHRTQNADQIDEILSGDGGEDHTDPSLVGRIHRWWIDKRQDWSDDPTEAVLSEIRRGEHTIREAYDKSLDAFKDLEVRSVLEGHLRDMEHVASRLEATAEQHDKS